MSTKRNRAKRKSSGPSASRTAATARQESGTAEEQETLDVTTAPSEQIEHWLASGEHPEDLRAVFGDEEYARLRRLAEEAFKDKRSVRARPWVVILPGILGSAIGEKRMPKRSNRIVWLDILRLPFGILNSLALPAGGGFEALDVVASHYSPLKLHLERSGFDVDYFPFDWRTSISSAGQALAAFLKQRGTARKTDKVRLVGHSMGGLVIRAAWPHLKRIAGLTVERVVTIGSPHGGSASPIRALRGNHDFSRLLALFSPGSAENHAREIFATFAGLAEMILNPRMTDGTDFFDLAAWPATGVRPPSALLRAAAPLQPALPLPDCPFHTIIGIDLPTLTNARVSGEQIEYYLSRDGDDTVPLGSAMVREATSAHYVRDRKNVRGLALFGARNEASHGALCTRERVGQAVVELLSAGDTSVLDRSAAFTGFRDRWETETALARGLPQRLATLTGEPPAALEQRAALMAEILHFGVELETEETLTAGPSLEQITLTRGRKGRLEISLAHGDIAQADTRAIVFGILQEVDPHSALRTLDRRLNNALNDALQRRLFQAHTGSMFILPTGRHPVTADMVVLMGLGRLDEFDLGTLEMATTNLTHTLIRTRVEDFATIVMGSSAGALEERLTSLLRGALRAFQDAGEPRSFRRIMFCEQSAEGYARLKQTLANLGFQELFKDIEISFDEVRLPEPPAAAYVRSPAGAAELLRPAYLKIETEKEGHKRPDQWQVRGILLLPDDSAAVSPFRHSFSHAEAIDLLARIPVQAEDPPWNRSDLAQFSRRLAMLLVPERTRSDVASLGDVPLVIIHDPPLARFPWECLEPDAKQPALRGGISRRYLLENFTSGRWPERTPGDGLRMLLVVDPTEDLEGARKEGRQLQNLLNTLPGVQLTSLWGPQATHAALTEHLRSEPYDIIHYAGHALFTPGRPDQSGLVCAGNVIFSAADLRSLTRTPAFVVLNACESARTRRAATEARELRHDHPAASLAEGFLRAGIANLIGTYWPVGDAAAKRFADVFYRRILEGAPAGAAILAARQQLHRQNDLDWPNYIHFGNAGFRLIR